MWAVAVAVAVMMWMWSAAGLHFSGWLERSNNYPVRMAYFAVIVALGATAILLPLWLVLPGSQLSLGWTLKQLQNTQQLSALLVGLTVSASLWRTHELLKPAVRLVEKTKPVPAAAAKAGQKKRRP
ncbi:MAG: hypothetical protein REI12_14635 [Pedobacter sp.]|nr:hypothetical protein [Pedobacter sp.]